MDTYIPLETVNRIGSDFFNQRGVDFVGLDTPKLTTTEVVKIKLDHMKKVHSYLTFKLPRFFKRAWMEKHCGMKMLKIISYSQKNRHKPVSTNNEEKFVTWFVCAETQCRHYAIY